MHGVSGRGRFFRRSAADGCDCAGNAGCDGSPGFSRAPVVTAAVTVCGFMYLFRPERVPAFPAAASVFLFCLFAAPPLLSWIAERWFLGRGGLSGGVLEMDSGDGSAPFSAWKTRVRIAAFAARFSAGGRPFFLAVAAGVLLGGAGVFRVHVSSLFPATLASPEKVTGVHVVLTGDPMPWGENAYRVDASARRFFYPDGSAFSAEGGLTLCFPSAVIRAALPENIARGRKRVYVCDGLELVCTGAFSSGGSSGGKTRFYVSEIEGAEAVPSLWGRVLEMRGRARFALLRLAHGWGAAGGLFLALSSGMRDFMDESISGVFRRAGLSHMLALSGMHLGILGGAVLFFGGKVGGKRFSVRLSLLALVFFLFFAGYSPSLFRACLFSLSLAAIRRIGFPVRFVPTLAVVFCIHIVVNPGDIYAVSFQLSYLATVGIFSAGDFFKEILQGVAPAKLCPGLSASLGAQFAVFPVSMSVFGMFAPIGIVAGLCLSLPVSFFLISGFCCVFLSSLFPFLCTACGFFLSAQYELIYGSASFFAGFPVLDAGRSPLCTPFALCILYLFLVPGGWFVLRTLRLRRMKGVDFSRL